MAKTDSLFYTSFVRLFELRFLIMPSCFHENIGEISWGLPLWDLEERMAEWTSDKSHQCLALWKFCWINLQWKARVQDWMEKKQLKCRQNVTFFFSDPNSFSGWAESTVKWDYHRGHGGIQICTLSPANPSYKSVRSVESCFTASFEIIWEQNVHIFDASCNRQV